MEKLPGTSKLMESAMFGAKRRTSYISIAIVFQLPQKPWEKSNSPEQKMTGMPFMKSVTP